MTNNRKLNRKELLFIVAPLFVIVLTLFVTAARQSAAERDKSMQRQGYNAKLVYQADGSTKTVYVEFRKPTQWEKFVYSVKNKISGK